MNADRFSRRRFLGSLTAGATLLALPSSARASGRTPNGGKFVLHVPWSVSTMDPHELGDPAAAIFGSAAFDPLFGLDAAGSPYPTLAQALPSREGGETVVRLREGLRTARGKFLDARDVIASIERARARAAAPLLVDVPRPQHRKGEALAVVFGNADPSMLARTLASPFVALVPRSFSASAPDGTGAFRAEASRAGLVLSRNGNAARGASFLDAVEALPAEDLKTSLRAFEAERDDVGWLGMGLHDGRKGAIRFDLGRFAFVVLTTGPEAGTFGMPGVAQRLVDAFPPERLAHLGLGALPPANGDPGWGGPATELLVDESSPHLLEVARAVVPILSRSGHEVSLSAVSRAEVGRRRARGKATLTVELVRPYTPSPSGILPALAMLDDVARAKDLARHPPKFQARTPARALTQTLRVGVIGEVRVAGGVIPDLALVRSASGEGWDLGASFRKRKG